MTGEGLQFGMSFAKDWEAELAAFVGSTSYGQGETHFMGTRHDKGPFMVVVALRVCAPPSTGVVAPTGLVP